MTKEFIEQNLYNVESLNKLEKETQAKVSFVKEHALSKEEYENISTEKAKMYSIQKKREFSDEEVEQFLSFLEKIEHATIFVETILEARRVMGLLKFNSHDIINTLAHENAHGNKADELKGEHVGYNFLLHKEANGNLIIEPSAKSEIPKGLNEEQKKLFLSRTLWAPHDYGNKISDADIEDIRKLYNKE